MSSKPSRSATLGSANSLRSVVVNYSERWWLACGALLAATTIGCGGENASMAIVRGVVTSNGQPLSKGIIVLFDKSAGDGASAPLDDQGRFSLSGPVRAGAYDVAFQPPPLPPPLEGGTAPAPSIAIPEKFQSPDTSGQVVEVTEGDNDVKIDFSF